MLERRSMLGGICRLESLSAMWRGGNLDILDRHRLNPAGCLLSFYERRFGLGDPSSVADFRELVPARREPAHTQTTLNSKLP